MSNLSVSKDIYSLCKFFEETNSQKILDFSDKNFVEPIFIAIIKALKYNKTIEGIKINTTKDSSSYIKRMLLDQTTSETLIPMTLVKSRADTEKAASEIVGKLNITEKQGKYEIKYILDELMINSLDHGESHAVTYCQVYRNLNEIEIGIVDTGIGFYKTISRTKNIKTEEEALKCSIQKGVSGAVQTVYSSASKHAGMGLFVISEMVKDSKGRMIIVSGNTIYDVVNDSVVKCPYNWQGSIVYLRFNRDSFNGIVSEIGLQYYIAMKTGNEEEDLF